MAKIKTEKQPRFITKTGLKVLFGVTPNTISLWLAKGLPEEAPGVFNVAKCVQWFRANTSLGGNAPKSHDKNSNEYRIAAAKAKKLERENEEADGTLISVESVEAFAGSLGTITSSALESLGSRLCNPLAGMEDPRAIQALIWSEARETRELICFQLKTLIDEQ